MVSVESDFEGQMLENDNKIEPLNFNTSLMGKMDGLAIYSEKVEESMSNEWPDQEASKDSLKLDCSVTETQLSAKQRSSKVPDKDKRQKFEFIYRRSIFRHFCAYLRQSFENFTENKKVHQN